MFYIFIFLRERSLKQAWHAKKLLSAEKRHHLVFHRAFLDFIALPYSEKDQ